MTVIVESAIAFNIPSSQRAVWNREMEQKQLNFEILESRISSSDAPRQIAQSTKNR